MNQQTQRGIAALKAGDRVAARQFLGEAVRQNPEDSTAWLWLSGAVESDDERVACLQRVLRLDPENQPAARGLEKIQARRAHGAGNQPVAEEAEQSEPAAQQTEPAAQQSEPAAQQSEPATQQSELGDPQTEAVTPQPEPAYAAVAADESQAQPAVLAVAGVGGNSQASGAGLAIDSSPSRPKPARLARSQPAAEVTGERIFRTRPSQVLALAAFWGFFFGAIGVGQILDDAGATNLPLAAALGGVLELVVVYVIIRNFSTRYELTTQSLSLPHQGRTLTVPVASLLHAEKQQNTIQGLLGSGDVIIDAVQDGQLTRLRLRDVPDVDKRVADLRKVLTARA